MILWVHIVLNRTVVVVGVIFRIKSPIQDYIHLDNHAQPNYEMTPGSKPVTIINNDTKKEKKVLAHSVRWASCQCIELWSTTRVAKCNLGKVNLEEMLVSSFSSYTGGGPMPLTGAPCDLYTQLLACSSLQSVVAIACCLRAILCFGFFPSLPPSWGKNWSVSIPLNCSVWRFLVGPAPRVAMDTSSEC